MAAHQAPPSLGFPRQEHWSGLPFPSPMHETEKWKWSCSVMSDSSQPHGLQPTRLLHPWDFLGKTTGVGCHCLLWLVYRNTINFGGLILYFITLLNLLISSIICVCVCVCVWNLKTFFLHKIYMQQRLLYFFSNLDPFYFSFAQLLWLKHPVLLIGGMRVDIFVLFLILHKKLLFTITILFFYYCIW